MFLISFYEARGAEIKKEIDVQLIKALAGGHVMMEKAEDKTGNFVLVGL